MLRAFDKLKGRRIHATDGEIGSVDDLYFDDATWGVRYLVVDAGNWLTGRKVLIIPGALGAPIGEKGPIPVRLTVEQVRNSPEIDTAKPVERRHEEALHAYYGWPLYWGGLSMVSPQSPGAAPNMPATGSYPGAVPPMWDAVEQEEEKGDPHLRSASGLDGYSIHAQDGEIGSVKDLIVDDREWRIRYFVVKTGGWFSGDRVLIAPAWIREISWSEASVHADLTRQAIHDSPPFDPDHPVDREYEEKLYRHYSRMKYWG